MWTWDAAWSRIARYITVTVRIIGKSWCHQILHILTPGDFYSDCILESGISSSPSTHFWVITKNGNNPNYWLSSCAILNPENIKKKAFRIGHTFYIEGEVRVISNDIPVIMRDPLPDRYQGYWHELGRRGCYRYYPSGGEILKNFASTTREHS